MNIIVNLLVIFIIFILVSLLWHQLFTLTTEESIVASAIVVMIGTFISGILGNVKYVYAILGILAFAGIILFLSNRSITGRKNGSIKERVLIFYNPTLFLLTILLIYAMIAFNGAIFTYPDEIFQWGPAVKYMYETGLLPYGSDFTGEEITLSMATMFQYLWTGLGEFTEQNCFIGNFILVFIPVYLPFSGATWKDMKKISLYTVFIFFSFNLITYIKYYNLLQDFVLPMWAGGVIAWLLWKKEHINWWLLYGTLLCINPMKSMVGPLFSVIILIVLVITIFINEDIKHLKDAISIKLIGYLAGAVVCIKAVNLVWSYLVGTNVNNRFITYDSQEKSLEAILKGLLNVSFTVKSSAIRTIPYVSYVIMFALVIVLIFVLRRHITDIKKKTLYTVSMSVYAIGFIGYLAIMFYAYMMVFGVEDSLIVAGLERYLSYYMLLGCVPLFSILCEEKLLTKGVAVNATKLVIVLLLIFGTGNDYISKVTTLNQTNDSTYSLRKAFQSYEERINKFVESDSEIFVLGKMSSTESKIMMYEFGSRYDYKFNCYQIYNRDVNTITLTNDVLRYPELLISRGYDYMWCYNAEQEMSVNPHLRYKYGLHDVTNGALYKIEHVDDGVIMHYIGNTNETD